MSITSVLLPMLAVLAGAEQYMGLSTTWKPANHAQANFIRYLPKKEKRLKYLSDQELKTIASQDYTVINKFLKDNGFTIQLEPFIGSESFGVASILDILVEWTHEGVPTTLTSNNKEYPAVLMEKNCFEVLQCSTYEHPILKLTAKNGDAVYMTIAQDKSYVALHGLYLFDYIDGLSKLPKTSVTSQYSQACFPMVDLDQKTDLSWLLRLGSLRITDNQVFQITQALQQTKFKMNEKGARAQSAVAIAFEKSCNQKKLSIDQPFYLWIERPGMKLPLFTACIDSTEWKTPAALSA
jgi:hypothetical protein